LEKESERLLKLLSNIVDTKLEINRELSLLTTMGLSSVGNSVEVYTVEALKKLLPILSQNKIPYRVIGRGANTLLPKFCTELIIVIKFQFNEASVDFTKESFSLPASLLLAKAVSMAANYKLKDWDKVAGIPATLGGAVVTNAGTSRGEISELLLSVTVIDTAGVQKKIMVEEGMFSYRNSTILKQGEGEVIIEVEFKNVGMDDTVSDKINKYLEERKSSQPLDKKTCGCVFKNYEGGVTCRAGKYIDIMGMKGFKTKNLAISLKHANFVEHTGGASLDDFLMLNIFVKDELRQHFGITFENEVII